MSAKFGARRRQAFLRALAQTGNQTISAERAKVSRSWVQLHRSSDAEFDAACRRAIEEAAQALSPLTPTLKLRPRVLGCAPHILRPSPPQGRGSSRPPSGWGYLDGAELVVAGSNRRHAQVRRARLTQWTPRVEERFLMSLAATCNVRAACAEVGMAVSSAYVHRKRWPAFARHWDAAIAVGYARVEAGLVEGAIRFFEGEPVPEDAPVRVMSVSEAIQALNMNKFAVKGVGGRPGVRRGKR